MYQPELYPPAAPAAARGRRRGTMLAVTAAAAGAAIAMATVYSSGGAQVVITGTGSVGPTTPALDGQGSGGAQGTGTTTLTRGSASAAQQIGVVDINTVLKYQGARAAGTGIVLSSTGEILTNNHVVSGATSISVQVVTTGRTYRATVVGTAPTEDVAVLRLENAAGLQTAVLGDSGTVQVGASVTGVGNAGGRGGTPSAAHGTVVALDQALTASDGSGQNSERLTGMIETDAPIRAGDSGGPLYDAAAHVLGMDTAASARASRTALGFAIPINRARAIAGEIEAGHASATIHLGYPGFLGVTASASPNTPGALVESVLGDGPAGRAGIKAGDVITAVGGTAVRSSTGLHAAMATLEPGQRVAIAWRDGANQAQRAVITLATGPAD